MATIKYLVQSNKSQSAPIYLRLSIGYGKVFKRKTGLTIDPNIWNNKYKSAMLPKVISLAKRRLL